MADHNHPGEPDLTWDHELSQWVRLRNAADEHASKGGAW